MVFADKEFYKNEYLLGRAATIPLAEFNYWGKKASRYINQKKIELEEIPSYLSECTCEVAEILFKDEQSRNPKAIHSQSLEGYSKTFVDQRQDPSEINQTIQGVINKYLANTAIHNDFVYTGVGI